MPGLYVSIYFTPTTQNSKTNKTSQAHAQIATLHYLSSQSQSTPSIPSLSLSLRHFCRAIELNDSYLRGFYGLKLLSQTLIIQLSSTPSTITSKRNKDKDAEDEDLPPPKLESVKKLEELATTKLALIIRNYSSGKTGWTGYDEAEIIAARELLDKERQTER